MRSLRIKQCLVFGCLLASAVASADNMRVSALVLGSCIFASDDALLDFGGMIPGQGDKTQSINVKFSCTKGMPYKVDLGYGQNFYKGDAAGRKMAALNGSDFLPYELVSDRLAGDGQGEGVMISLQLTGKVRGQDYSRVTTGDYADMVLLTVSP